MNTLVSDNIALGRNAEPVAFDVVRSMPRRVVGFATMVETGLPLEALEPSIAEVAENTAFRLASLEITDENPAEGGRLVRAEFVQRATFGTTGDTQIFALLRDLAVRHRWNGVVKHLAR